MKKLLLPILLFTLSLIVFSNSAFASEKGTRSNPFSAYDENTITFKPLSPNISKKVSIQLQELQIGTDLNAEMKSESKFNRNPKEDEQWNLFKYKINYISSSKDEPLQLSKLLPYSDQTFYFDSNFKAIFQLGVDRAILGDKYGSLNLGTIWLKPGTSTIAYTAIIMKKKNIYPYFRIETSPDKYYWFSTDPNYKPKEDVPVEPINLSDSNVKITMNNDQLSYTGRSLKPNVTIDVNNKKLTNNKDYKLTYSNNTDVGYGYVTVNGIGDYTGTKELKFSIAPVKSNIYSIKNSNSKSATLKWNEVTGAKYYKVYYKTGSKTKSIETTNTSYNVKKLSKNKKYSFYVVSYYDSKVYSPNSNTKTITIKK